MIHYLQGIAEYKEGKFLVVGVAGIGYKVFCSPNTLKKVSEGQEVKIFTHLHLKEDAAELYGFLTSEELNLFDVLNTISGIGPKTAMMLASLGSLENLKEMMEGGRLPPEIKGIGQKKMQKILLELTGKIKEIKSSEGKKVDGEALAALVALGFSKQKATEALMKISPEIKESGKKVKEALKVIR